MLYPLKFPKFISRIFPMLISRIKTNNKEIFLTFDDGPNTEITPWVLEILKKNNAKATFFCTGENSNKNPEILQQIKTEGHSIGNHTYHHMDGWKTPPSLYIKEVELAQTALNKNDIHTRLFRPPYGRISPFLLKKLSKNHQIILWTYLVGDYSKHLSSQKVVEKLVRKLKPGDIIVLHDSPKSFSNLQYILPVLIKKLRNKGYQFKAINQ